MTGNNHSKDYMIISNCYRYLSAVLLVCLLTTALPERADAVRPFVTDDARVVGDRLFLLETSLKANNGLLQNMNLFAYGPSDKLELTVGFSDGFTTKGDDRHRLSIGGIIGQAKYLFTPGTENGLPGIAVVTGFGAPYGTNSFKEESWTNFGYLALTEALGEKERVLIHANVGVNYTKSDDKYRTSATWGLGTQVRMIGGFHFVGEVFHGDPYAGDSGWAFQTGVRYFVSERLQLDATAGSGFAGNNQPKAFAGCGLRFVLDAPWRSKATY